eukprot:7452041-Ditylum_brightwellii.AAC.1
MPSAILLKSLLAKFVLRTMFKIPGVIGGIGRPRDVVHARHASYNVACCILVGHIAKSCQMDSSCIGLSLFAPLRIMLSCVDDHISLIDFVLGARTTCSNIYIFVLVADTGACAALGCVFVGLGIAGGNKALNTVSQ